MKLGILYLADVFHGYGHHYRCQTVAQTARKYGHQVKIISNAFGADIYINQLHNTPDLVTAIRESCFDWLIIDLEEVAPAWVYELAHQCNSKVANLNGIGWNVATDEADLIWVQDTPERVILRDSVLQTQRKHGNYWFVFGGSADPLGLCEAFTTNLPDQSAFLMQTSLNTGLLKPKSSIHRTAIVHDDTILPYMASAQYACIHCGMMMWECAYLGVPSYIFSRSAEHLHFAQNLENYAFARAYPEIGLPDKKVMRSFLLDTPRFVVPMENRPDGNGVKRFIEALENYNG